MAVTLLRVLVLGAIAAAADDVPITWWLSPRAALQCVVPDAERIQARRPPPPLEAEDRTSQMPYIWRRGVDNIKQSPVNSSLEVYRRKEGSGDGVYQCAVRHQAGLVLGYPINLKFTYLDKQFSVQPENATARAGQPFVLTCDITPGLPVETIWLRDHNPLPDAGRYHWTQMNNQLLITDVKKEDGGSYRCKVTIKDANNASKTRLSRPGKLLVVDGDEELEPAMLPLKKNSYIAVARGSKVVLPCPVVGWPKPKLKWELDPPADRKRELEEVDEVLVLPTIELDQEGVYTCSVEGHSDIIRVYNVTLSEKPVITLPPMSKHVVRASTVRFNCTAAGNPPPSITWYKDGIPLNFTGRIVVLPSVSSKQLELLIRTVTSGDRGVYQCFASNSVGVTSAWATLNVTGVEAAGPAAVRCLPVGPRTIRVQWAAVPNTFVYTVQSTIIGGTSLPGPPILETQKDINVEQPLTAYGFQVTAFIQSPITNKTQASAMSESVTCQGQGVPVKLAKLDDVHILVSWQQFTKRTPGVVQWILQYRIENTSVEHNITLDGSVNNYTLRMPSSTPLQIRLLGSRTLEWIPQDLSAVPWNSTSGARHYLDGEVTDVPRGVKVTQVLAREFTVRWECDEQPSLKPYTFRVCVKNLLDDIQECLDSATNFAVVKNLEPNGEYAVQVQARIPGQDIGGDFSDPIHISTPEEEQGHIADLTYKFVNDSTVRVSWNSVPDKYRVHYSKVLKLPVDQWVSVETLGNTVLIPGVDRSSSLYVMVARYEPLGYSSVLSIPARTTVVEPDQSDLKYEYTSAGVLVSWRGVGPRVVRYSQNLTHSLDMWTIINVNDSSVEISGLDPERGTFVMVAPPGVNPRSHEVLTIPPRPTESNSFYMVIAICVSLIVLALLFVAAVCLWKRRKRTRSPNSYSTATRRRNVSSGEGSDEEGAEMKNIGGRLANGGGSKNAGEPLLNGHVHITVNPTSKTPNGRMRKGHRYEAAFDVSRYEDQDTTLETVLDADTSASTTYNLLDTSRRPEYDSRSSRDVSANNSFSKLPDNNMNSEFTRSVDFELDNSKILPTLQPNG